MISQGYQVIWLAHRSLLLEQTANTFYRNASLLKLADPERKKLTLLCISSEHCSIHNADKNDDIMKTQALKQALDKYGFTAAFGGGRRDEEKSRAKERIFSSCGHGDSLRGF